MSVHFCVGARKTHAAYPRVVGLFRRPIKKEYKHMDDHNYKLYVLKKKKKILRVKTKSYSNLRAFLYSLRKQGFVCEVEYPRRKQ